MALLNLSKIKLMVELKSLTLGFVGKWLTSFYLKTKGPDKYICEKKLIDGTVNFTC